MSSIATNTCGRRPRKEPIANDEIPIIGSDLVKGNEGVVVPGFQQAYCTTRTASVSTPRRPNIGPTSFSCFDFFSPFVVYFLWQDRLLIVIYDRTSAVAAGFLVDLCMANGVRKCSRTWIMDPTSFFLFRFLLTNFREFPFGGLINDCSMTGSERVLPGFWTIVWREERRL